MSTKAWVLAGPTPLDALEAPDFDLEQRDAEGPPEWTDEHKQADDRERAADINATLRGW